MTLSRLEFILTRRNVSITILVLILRLLRLKRDKLWIFPVQLLVLRDQSSARNTVGEQ